MRRERLAYLYAKLNDDDDQSVASESSSASQILRDADRACKKRTRRSRRPQEMSNSSNRTRERMSNSSSGRHRDRMGSSSGRHRDRMGSSSGGDRDRMGNSSERSRVRKRPKQAKERSGSFGDTTALFRLMSGDHENDNDDDDISVLTDATNKTTENRCRRGGGRSRDKAARAPRRMPSNDWNDYGHLTPKRDRKPALKPLLLGPSMKKQPNEKPEYIWTPLRKAKRDRKQEYRNEARREPRSRERRQISRAPGSSSMRSTRPHPQRRGSHASVSLTRGPPQRRGSHASVRLTRVPPQKRESHTIRRSNTWNTFQLEQNLEQDEEREKPLERSGAHTGLNLTRRPPQRRGSHTLRRSNTWNTIQLEQNLAQLPSLIAHTSLEDEEKEEEVNPWLNPFLQSQEEEKVEDDENVSVAEDRRGLLSKGGAQRHVLSASQNSKRTPSNIQPGVYRNLIASKCA